ncbi:MAG TPA: peptidase domain-containing ABC transporter [Ignavibacteria bacterium]|nr:peptidase domain-containing ABC transporter [Ignavibacteria bacterium]
MGYLSTLRFPNYRQYSDNDCGPASLRIIARYYGKDYPLEYIRDIIGVSREGSTLLSISKGAEYLGFKTLCIKTRLDKISVLPVPFIVFFRSSHFVVTYKITDRHVYISDPSFGLIKYTIKEFTDRWADNEGEGFVLLFETSESFYTRESIAAKENTGFKFLAKHFYLYKQLFIQLFVGLLITTVFSVISPFLTQSLVDVGIGQKSIGFIYLILIAQIILFLSQNSVGFIRSWIFLHISTKINISLVSDFLYKLMRLPVMFIESRSFGDIYQRIFDLSRIQNFISATTLNFIYSFLSLILFSFVLISYSQQIFLIFLGGSAIGIIWIFLFLSKRKELDYKRFFEMSTSQNAMVQILTGMKEIKLSGAEKQKRNEWEHIQTRIFRISINSLYWSQIQQFGSLFFNQLKNILITIIAANQVINGEITIGMMVAITFIIGQINAPIEQLIGIIQVFQDAKISLARIAEVYNNEDEETKDHTYITDIPYGKSIVFENVSFKYYKNDLNDVIRNLSFHIPENRITAIVGSSGSGKTTIIKLLLKYYKTSGGTISVGDKDINDLSPSEWRKRCGCVMQDGYFFSDTLANNITLGDEEPNKEGLEYAIKQSNLKEFIDSLPKGHETKIGMMGEGISKGQRQRILIARTIYRNPDFVFFDEATSDLDSENESKIMDNLYGFFKNKTVLIVAHRLSTVKTADNIIVLDNGAIAEQGKHAELLSLRGTYYRLFKSQF